MSLPIETLLRRSRHIRAGSKDARSGCNDNARWQISKHQYAA